MRRGWLRLDVRKFIKEAHPATFGRPPPQRNRLTRLAACEDLGKDMALADAELASEIIG
jgi:hypothetical protein